MKTLIKMASSGLYAGYSPFASGTVGSAWSVLIFLQLERYPGIYLVVVGLLFLLGFLVCSPAEEIFGRKDSRRIVIDEIASLCLVYLFIKPTWLMLGAGFVLFRFFDIIKPPPARRIQALQGARGVMLDDVVAALYTVVCLSAISFIQRAGILQALCR